MLSKLPAYTQENIFSIATEDSSSVLLTYLPMAFKVMPMFGLFTKNYKQTEIK